MGRRDARHLKEIESYHTFYTFLMPKRTQSVVWTVVQADASGILDFIKEKNATGHNITIFQIVIAALLRTASQFPEMNRFIYNHKFYARNEYTVSFAVNLEDKTVMRKVWLQPEFDVFEVSKTLGRTVSEARSNPNDNLDSSIDFMTKLPKFITTLIFKMYPWLVDVGIMPKKFALEDPLYSSALVSNLGTFGLNAPFHHLYEWGNISVFVTIGAIHKAPVVSSDGDLKVADVIDCGFTVDERICDGKELSEALMYFKKCMEEPTILAVPPQKVVRE